MRSSVIRLIKRAYQHKGISMPDEAREVVFPRSVPVVLVDERQTTDPGAGQKPPPAEAVGSVATEAETGLSSDAKMLAEQARRAKPVATGDNLLRDDASDDATGARTPGS